MSLEWESKSFSNLVDIIGGGTPKTSVEEYWDGDIPWISIKDFNNGQKYVLNTEKTITELGLKNSSTKILKKNDIIISARGTVGEVAMIKYDMAFNQSCYGLRVHDFLDKEFVYYLLKYNISKLKNMVHGAVFDTITTNTFENIIVNLPPLKYQEKISFLLSNIDNLIEVKIHENKNLEEQLNLIFNDWFVNCTPFKNEELIKLEWGFVPESWKDIEFGELIEITSGDRPKEKSEIKTSEFKIPLFGASKIMGYTKEVLYNEDILIIGRVGTHGVVQRVNYPCFPSDNTFVIKSKYYGFVYQLLKKIDYDSLNTGSTQPLITQKSLKTVNVVLPDKKILSIFEMISKVIFDKIYLNNNEIFNLTKLRDTLLPKLMSGEIDVSEVNCDLELICKLTLFTHKYPNQLCKHKLIHLNLKSLRKSKNTAFKVDFGQFLFYN